MALALAIKGRMVDAKKVVECVGELVERTAVSESSSVKHSVDPLTGNPVIEIYPSDSIAARISIRVAESSVILSFGHGAVFEIPEGGGRYTALDLCGEIQALCNAVMRGCLDETVFFQEGQVVGARARIKVSDDNIAHERWRELSFKSLFRCVETKTFTYGPYSGRAGLR